MPPPLREEGVRAEGLRHGLDFVGPCAGEALRAVARLEWRCQHCAALLVQRYNNLKAWGCNHRCGLAAAAATDALGPVRAAAGRVGGALGGGKASAEDKAAAGRVGVRSLLLRLHPLW